MLRSCVSVCPLMWLSTAPTAWHNRTMRLCPLLRHFSDTLAISLLLMENKAEEGGPALKSKHLAQSNYKQGKFVYEPAVCLKFSKRTEQQETPGLIKICTIIEKGFWIMNIHRVARTPFCISQWQESLSTPKLQKSYVPHTPNYFLRVSSDKVFRFFLR